MLQTVKKIIYLLSKSERKKALVLVGLIVIMAALDVIGVASIMPFIATIANPGIIKTNTILAKTYEMFDFQSEKSFLMFLGIVVIISLVSSLAYKAFATYAQLRFTLMREFTIGTRLVEGYLSQPYTWFLNRHSSDLGNVVLSEVNQVIGNAITPVMTLIAQGLLSTTLLLLLILMDPKLALIVGAVLGLTYGIFYYIVRNLLSKVGSDRVKANLDRYKAVNEAFSGIKEVKVGGLEKTYANLFARPAEIYAKSHASVQVIMQLPRFAIEAVAFGGMLLVVLYLMSGTGGFASGLPIVAVYSLAGYRLMPALQLVYASIVQLRSTNASLDVIYNDLNSIPAVKEENTSSDVLPLNKSIQLKEVNFSYPLAKKQALQNLNLEIPALKTIGMIGVSGSGKTTTVDLILGLLEPDSGIFEVDGVSINSFNLRNWQKGIGYVPQQIFLTDDSIAANIAFGQPVDKIDMNAVERAAKIANMHDFVVNELPQGYQTAVGERGVRLSGGQRQRIGIARALYNKPQLLILDEATSALDNLTEKAVMEAVNNLGGDITIIIIAHRLSTVRSCDKIYMMQHGQVIANGAYDELLKYNESFQAMASR
jgi:ABC-type bacteriocin/lantibiotic exporter with double-glycine peptidase domain